MNNTAGYSDVLLLDDDSWLDYFGDVKYRFILLDLARFYNESSFVDIFMLASSRMSKQGEFALRFTNAQYQQSVLHSSLFTYLCSAADAYSFKLMNRYSPNATSRLFIFRFDGESTKTGYQISRAVSFSKESRQLFSGAFNHSISESFWNWKYPKDKVNHSVVAVKSNKAIAHYGLCDRKAFYNGFSYDFAQACDVMVDSGSRGAISSSVFYDLVRHGEKPFYSNGSSISLIYGFPHGRHYKLGARLKLYQPVGAIFEVVYRLSDIGNLTINIEIEPDVVSQVDARRVKDNLESAMLLMNSAKDTVLLARDYLYFLQRYIYHPEYYYDVYQVKDTFFVIKKTDKQLSVMDFFGDINDYPKMLVLLVDFLAEHFTECSLYLWCLKDIVNDFIGFTAVKETDAVFVCKTYSPDLPEFSRWWITMGDTEFL